MTNFKELTTKTWKDFEQLFGEQGACEGCWCMYWRLRHKDYKPNRGINNKKSIKGLIKNNQQIGILMYVDNEPVGWCSVAPREDFIRLQNSKILKPIDGKPVWSIVCFFINKKHRRKSYSTKLLEAVIKIVKKKGAKILEGYPHEPKNDNMPAAFAWTGISNSFIKAGFKEVARRSETRPIMRYNL
ncbi:MAG: GNAT family N-acetyltransferase [Ignavibacteriae bacterium]|nr:GNAT family N-acetyltransferase [Ignavibacteriota bacterium]MCB9209621.1 GNAT family N-acetyltransferase [Ignavibacteriales bacterium]